jgi:serine/threonine protein phosphatase 1
MNAMSVPSPHSPSIYVSGWEPAPAILAPGTCVCAIGDVHGESRLFDALVDWLLLHVLGRRTAGQHLVLIGDYVDRGPDSLGVMARVARLDPPQVDVTRLCGNHDIFFDTFLRDPRCDLDFVIFWMSNGGDTTLQELGITFAECKGLGIAAARRKALARLDADLAALPRRLVPSRRIGGYLFAHAGVHPERPFDPGNVTELTTIREPFLSAPVWRHDFVVVHGHTICGPDVRRHRIAIDSGAFHTGVLTAVHLEEDWLRFIVASDQPPQDATLRLQRRNPRRQETWVRQG